MPREFVTFKCTECGEETYYGSRNKKKHPEKMEIKKFCPKCNKMMPVKIFTGGRYVCKKCGTRIDETTIHFIY